MEEPYHIKMVLDDLFHKCDNVFIVTHSRPDVDALGSAIGMSLICKRIKKKSFIVIDDNYDKIEAATRKILEEVKDDFDFITADEVKNVLTDNSLMIAVDVNKDYLISVKEYLDKFKEIAILDHHKTDENTIKTQNMFIDDKISSTCEVVSKLIFQYGVKINKDQANYLLAGIILDTNKMSKNVGPETFSVAAKLASRGADAAIANNMFLEDFEHDRAIQRLVDNTIFPTYIYAIAVDKDGKIYESEDVAKAADYLLKYQVNASFAIAPIDEETISISARSKGIIDVSKIMKLFGGGGGEHSAAAKVKGMTVEEIKAKLNNILIPPNYLEEEKNVSNELKLKPGNGMI